MVTVNDTMACSASITPWVVYQYPFSDSWLYVFDFILYGVFLCVLTVFGFIGNTLSIIMLRKGILGQTVSIYLIGLAVFDNICIIPHTLMIFSTGFKSVMNIDIFCGFLYGYILRYQTFFIRFSTAAIGFFTVMITLTRFLDVSNPLKRVRFTRPLIAKIVAVVIAIVSPSMNIVSLFKGEVVTCYLEKLDMVIFYRIGTNIISAEDTFVENIAVTVITVYTTWTIVAVFNCFLIYKLWQSRNKRRDMNVHMTNDSTQKTTTILLFITISYMILLFPLMIQINVLNYFGYKFTYSVCRSPGDTAGVRIGATMLLLRMSNSCINFAIYCIGASFRKALRTTLCKLNAFKRDGAAGLPGDRVTTGSIVTTEQ